MHQTPAADSYFHRVARLTRTRMWINNPTPAEAVWARAAGAVSCTSNPTYVARMLQVDQTAAMAAIDARLARGGDDDAVADGVQVDLLRRILDIFAPDVDPARREAGFVSVQGDPRRDTDPDHIQHEIARHRAACGPGYVAKIPATRAGLVAIAACLRQDIPVIATEVFSLSQALAVAEVRRACGGRTPLYLTHISGIFDDYLAADAARRGVVVPPDLLRMAGLIVAKEQYRLLHDRGCEGLVMLGGGARAAHHFTEVVGGTMHVTLNPGTVQELITADQPVIPRIHHQADAATIALLCDRLPDLRTALIPEAQRPEEFETYGPVRHFLGMFITGWTAMLTAIAARRSARG
jgi:transaldolase